MKKSDLSNLSDYFKNYLKNIEEEEIIPALEKTLQCTLNFIKGLPADKLEYRYQENKWTVKEILCHLIDSERIISYRALWIARNDKLELPGYDQDEFIKYSKANSRSIDELLEDFTSARISNIHLFKSFDEEMLLRSGIANKKEVNVGLLGFLICGHVLHHLKVIKEKYL